MFNIFSCASWPSVCLPWRKVYSDLRPCFDWVFVVVVCLFVCLWSSMHCFYILEINPLLVTSCANAFSCYLLILFIVCCAKAFKFNQVPFLYFCFYIHYSKRWSQNKYCYDLMSKSFLPKFSRRSFIASGLCTPFCASSILV